MKFRSDMRKLRVLDLFSGIGGFSLGLERTGGFETVAFCEIEPYCRAVLAKHWPNVPCYNDIRKLGRLETRVDVVCGGFPCQAFSTASRGRRVAADLWPEMLRIIRLNRPGVVIAENVSEEAISNAAKHLNGDGYSTHCSRISGVDAGADHQRDRWWAVAYADAESELRGAVDAEVAKLSEVCRGLWGPENYARAIRVSYGLPHRVDERRRIEALGNTVFPFIPEAIGRAVLSVNRH
jgi:DNA (cytosine-5)-methyltransferase 1